MLMDRSMYGRSIAHVILRVRPSMLSLRCLVSAPYRDVIGTFGHLSARYGFIEAYCSAKRGAGKNPSRFRWA